MEHNQGDKVNRDEHQSLREHLEAEQELSGYISGNVLSTGTPRQLVVNV